MEDGSKSSMYKTAQVGRFNEQGVWQPERSTTTAASTTAATTAPKSTTAQSTTARPVTTQAQATTAKPTTAGDKATGTSGDRPTRRSLPRTASLISLYELLSGLSIAGGLAIRRFRNAA
jgi:hypothetical protein